MGRFNPPPKTGQFIPPAAKYKDKLPIARCLSFYMYKHARSYPVMLMVYMSDRPV
jgi:hypothetical protein